MADIKNALNKQVSRGESLAQIVIILIAVLGVAQFTHILAAQPERVDVAKTVSVGATGAMGAKGDTGATGKPGAAGLAGAPGATGASGASGKQGLAGANGIPGVLSSAYGELSVSSQGISIETPNDWVPIPFNITGPSSNMDVSTVSPATITVKESGVCQVNISVYFSSEDSDEGTFTPATYTLGVKVNDDTIRPVAAIFAGEPGQFLLNFSDIMDLSANNTIKFYMSASDAEPDIFSNIVTLENGNAYVMQISN